MTRDDIIRMAREAGWPSMAVDRLPGTEDMLRLERFAALVAAEKDQAFDAAANSVVKNIEKYYAMKAEMETYKREVAVLQKALDAALDFAGTVGGSSSWWEEIWAEHEAAIDAARSET